MNSLAKSRSLYNIYLADFLNQPKELCSHLCEKASKGTFIKPEKLQNQINKEKERRKEERGEGKEEKKKKQWFLSFYKSYIGDGTL